MNPRSPWPPLLGEVGEGDPHEFMTNGVAIHDTGASIYVPALVSRKTVQDLSAAARAWDAAHPPDPSAPAGWNERRNHYREMLQMVQRDADQFAGGDVDRLGDLGRYFASFVVWPFN